jgi:maltose O-acetyltransferase
MIRLLARPLRCFVRRLRRHYYRDTCRFYAMLAGTTFQLHWPVIFYAPVRVGGSGTVEVGAGTTFGVAQAPRLGNGESLLLAKRQNDRLIIGNRVAFSNNVSIICTNEITIADDCLVGDMVCIYDSDFHGISPDERRSNSGISKSVCIERNVWLGSRCIVLKGVTVGENSIIAAMSVVTDSIPSNSIAAGNPARVVKRIGLGDRT